LFLEQDRSFYCFSIYLIFLQVVQDLLYCSIPGIYFANCLEFCLVVGFNRDCVNLRAVIYYRVALYIEYSIGGFWFVTDIVCPSAEYIRPAILVAFSVQYFEVVYSKSFRLSNLSSIQYLSSSKIEKVLVVRVYLDLVFGTFKIYLLFL
jgi:hypothetical protein